MTSHDDALSLRTLDARLRAIEAAKIESDVLHRSLLSSDSLTAAAVDKLAQTINDPKTGLIVELDKFRAEVVADRRAFRAWIRGATAVLGLVITVVTVAAPWIRAIVETALNVRSPGL